MQHHLLDVETWAAPESLTGHGKYSESIQLLRTFSFYGSFVLLHHFFRRSSTYWFFQFPTKTLSLHSRCPCLPVRTELHLLHSYSICCQLSWNVTRASCDLLDSRIISCPAPSRCFLSLRLRRDCICPCTRGITGLGALVFSIIRRRHVLVLLLCSPSCLSG